MYSTNKLLTNSSETEISRALPAWLVEKHGATESEGQRVEKVPHGAVPHELDVHKADRQEAQTEGGEVGKRTKVVNRH